MSAEFVLNVNGREARVRTPPERPLLNVLREDLGLTGTKYGCGESRCGACTVLLDGSPRFSCQLQVAEAEGKAITTIEGLADRDRLHPVQEAFLAEKAYQCGYCTPGMILATVALLRENPRPSDDDIRLALNGHLCRCCGYENIVQAVRRAATG
jgi:aerobic-type carbon monoxide dehydrogenase small subunit (CoxS/CutS family)